jgi:hypothetical protein
VKNKHDFEPFSVNHVTHIPLSDKILKVPDGLSEYISQKHIGIAQVFYYEARWSENW